MVKLTSNSLTRVVRDIFSFLKCGACKKKEASMMIWSLWSVNNYDSDLIGDINERILDRIHKIITSKHKQEK